MTQYDMPYRMVKAKGGKTAVFINVEDPEALDTVRARHGNRDLLVSVAFYESADPSSQCVYALCFHVRSSSREQARQNALAENCGIPPESLDLIYNGGGIAAENDGRISAGVATPAEITILVRPAVFGSRPTPLMLGLNYDLAQHMNADGLRVDVDAYAKERQFVWLPNTFNNDAGGHAVVIRADELLNLSAKAIGALSVRPRDDDSFAVCRLVLETAEWFAETLQEKERCEKRQLQLRQRLLQRGWFVPRCIRRQEWADLDQEHALEACRVTAGLYAFCGASEDEVYEHLRRIDRRNDIGDYARLQNIIAFSLENPAFAGCEHPLLRRFCPTGGCLMKELIHDCHSPSLFT
jgi:hypothetical protein